MFGMFIKPNRFKHTYLSERNPLNCPGNLKYTRDLQKQKHCNINIMILARALKGITREPDSKPTCLGHWTLA